MKILLLFLTLAWLAGCKTPQPAFSYTPDQIVPKEKSLFWKISGNGLKKPSYLYGTIHLIPKKEYEMPNAVREALDRSQRVAFEIDMKELTNLKTQLSLISKSFMAGGKTIKDLLSPEDYAFIKTKMNEKGLPPGMMERMKPLFLSTLFSSEEETDTNAEAKSMTSVEMEMYKSARNRKLETAGLETTAYQMSIFDSIPYQVQAKMLIDGLRSTETDTSGVSQLDQLLNLYKDQDINKMQSMIAEEGDGMAAYEEILLQKRNRNWVAPMAKMMREKPTIFAVGAGHLGGPVGMIALLRKEGYRVEPAL